MRSLALAISLFAHVCAWVAFLFLLLWPNFYTGQSAVAAAAHNRDLPSRAPLTRVEPGTPPESFSATIVEVNGRRVIPILALPVVLTATAVVAVILLRGSPRLGMALLWTSTILIVLFSLLGMLSIGLFYFPAALAMILASVVGSLFGSRELDRPAAH